jgi:hypothetical protein
MLGDLDRVRGLLTRQKPLARQALSQLLDGRIAWTPRKAEGLYQYKGRVKFDELFSGIIELPLSVVAVRGFDTSRNPLVAIGLAFDGTVGVVA